MKVIMKIIPTDLKKFNYPILLVVGLQLVTKRILTLSRTIPSTRHDKYMMRYMIKKHIPIYIILSSNSMKTPEFWIVSK